MSTVNWLALRKKYLEPSKILNELLKVAGESYWRSEKWKWANTSSWCIVKELRMGS